jgi:hypothetical protein
LKSFDADCDQICRYERVLREHPDVLDTLVRGDRCRLLRFALIYRWPLVIPYHAAPDLVVLHAERIIRDLNDGAKTIEQLVAPKPAARLARVASREIRVAEWTFETPGIQLAE